MELDLVTNVKVANCEMGVFEAADFNEPFHFQFQIILDHASS